MLKRGEMKTEIRKILKKHGYIKQKTVGNIIIYLKKIDDRYSVGFKYDKHQVNGVPLVSYGILDRYVFEIINAIEQTPAIGIYSFTYGYPLNFRYFENGQFDGNKLSLTVNLITDKIMEFNEKEHDFISSYVKYLSKVEDELSLSSNESEQQVDVLFEYYSFVFRICNSEVITIENIKSVIIKLKNVDTNGFLECRLELLIKWLSSQRTIEK